MPRAALRSLAVLIIVGGFATVARAEQASAAGPPPIAGVREDPCAGVPLEPNAVHRAASDSYARWMHDWLALDWGQNCRYRRENAILPDASRRRVVFLGDSITELWKELDPGFFTGDILDRGISGQTTPQMLVRFRADVLDLHPHVVHIMAGTNDLAGNTGPTSLVRIRGNIESMVELARRHGIRVILGSIAPATRFPWRPDVEPAGSIRAMNAWLRDYAMHEHLLFVDYYSVLSDRDGSLKASLSDDGVHPNAAGYAAMRPLAEAALRQVLPQPVTGHN